MATKGAPVGRVTLPSPNSAIKDTAVISQFNDLNVALVREFDRRVQQDVSYDNFLLISPGGKAFKVTVSDTGVLTTTLMYQPPPP